MFERFGVLFLFFLLLNQVSRNIYSFLSNILFSTSPLYLLGKASSGRPRQRRLFIPSASSYQRRIIPCLSPNLSGLLSILTLSQQQDHRIGDPLDPLQSQLTQERIDFLCFFSFMPFLGTTKPEWSWIQVLYFPPPLPMYGASSLAHLLRPDWAEFPILWAASLLGMPSLRESRR